MKKFIIMGFTFLLFFASANVKDAMAQTYICQWEEGFGGCVLHDSGGCDGPTDCEGFDTSSACCSGNELDEDGYCEGSHACYVPVPADSSVDWNYLESLTLRSDFLAASPGYIISEFMKLLFPIAGLILLLMLLYGGYNMMFSGGDPKRAATAKGIVTTALLGFVIIFTSYWIVKIVGNIFGLSQVSSLSGGGVFD